MFPVSEELLRIFVATAFVSLCISFFVLALKKHKWFAAGPVILMALAIGWSYWEAQTGPYGQYAGLLVVFVAAYSLAGVFAALLWSGLVCIFADAISRRRSWMLSGRNAIARALCVAILPGLLLTAYAFERQIVPDHACASEGLPVSVADDVYQLIPELAVRLDAYEQDSGSRFLARYSDQRGDKESVKLLCEMSKRASVPIPVDVIWITPAAVQERVHQTCEQGKISAKFLCRGFDMDDFGQLLMAKIMIYRPSSMRGYTGWFNNPYDRDVLTAGDERNGFICHQSQGADETAHCTVWRQINQESFIQVKTAKISGPDASNALAVANRGIDFVLDALSASEPTDQGNGL